MSGPGGTINLTEADDIFPGIGDDNSGNETIFALGGNDHIHAGLGDDVVYGGIGDDDLFGEDGSDFLQGDDGNDHIEGGAGNDSIWDFAGTLCHLAGGGGNDSFEIGSSFGLLSTIDGGSGYDSLALTNTLSLQLISVTGIEELDTFGAVATATVDQFESFRSIQSSGEDPNAPVSLVLAGVGLANFLDLRGELGGRAANVTGSGDDDFLILGSGGDTVDGVSATTR